MYHFNVTHVELTSFCGFFNYIITGFRVQERQELMFSVSILFIIHTFSIIQFFNV